MKHFCSRKILMITHQLSRTGAPIALLNVARLLREEGNEIDLISLDNGPLKEEFEELGISVSIENEILQKWETYLPHFETYDLVFCNTIVTYEAIHILNHSNVPAIWWIHEPKEYFDMISEVLPDISNLKSNIRLWSVSPANQAYLEKTYGVDSTIVSLFVSDLKNSNEEKTINNSKIRYLCVGAYSYTKGQDILLEAIASLDENIRKEIEVYFCGDEATSDQKYVNLVKTAEKEYPIFRLGSLSQKELFQKMTEADYLICPSRMEAMPTVAAEAMMMSLPAVLSDGCGIIKMLGEYPLVFEKESVESIRNAIENSYKIRKGEGYGCLKQKMRQLYEEYFSKERYRNRLFELMESYLPQKRLVFLTGNYDVLDIFTLELERSFQDMGYEIFDFDCSNLERTLSEFGGFLEKGPVNAAFTFNFYSTFMEISAKKIVWQQYNIPIITYLMDHPFCFDPNLKKMGENNIILCPDKNHMNYVSRFYPNVPVCGFLGHGGIEKYSKKKPIKDRKIEVLYAGGISAPNVEKIRPNYSKYDFDAKLLGEEAFAYLIEHPSETTEDVLEEMLKKHGVSMSDEELRSFIFDMHYVDLQIVSHFREKTVRTIAEAGVPITLYGFGWENFDWIKDLNVDYRGRVSAFEIIDLMADAKIVLSTMTWFKDGTHDRVFNGQLQGAFAVTDTSKYMTEEYVGVYPDDVEKQDVDAEIGFFNLNEIDKLPRMIKVLLNDEKQLQRLAIQGYEKAKAHHSWEERAKELDKDLLLYM